MTTAWEFPKNPLKDPTLDDSRLSNEIRLGFRIFTDPPHAAPQFTPSKVSCNNCHLNGGQRERSLPLVGVAGMFPEYNRRSGRLYSLNDRIVDCFWRSENGTGVLEGNEEPGLAARQSRGWRLFRSVGRVSRRLVAGVVSVRGEPPRGREAVERNGDGNEAGNAGTGVTALAGFFHYVRVGPNDADADDATSPGDEHESSTRH